MSAAATTELTSLLRSPSLPTFFDNLDSFAEAPEGVAKLRELILDLAVRGKLVEQDENDEPAVELLGRMHAARKRLVSEKKLKKSKPLPTVDNGELLYRLPSGWAATRIGEVTSISTGYAFKSPDYTPTGTFVLRVTNIKPNGTIIPDDAVFMPAEKITPRIEGYYLEEGDILVVMVGGSLGKIGVVTEDLLPALLNQNMWRLRPISDDYDVEFLRLTLEYINKFQLNITSSTHGHMSMTEYKTQPIGVPPLSEQRRIVSKVDGLMSLCDELESRGSERVRLRERASRSCLDRLVRASSSKDLSSAWQRLSDHFEVLYDTPETLAHLRRPIIQLAVQGLLVPQEAETPAPPPQIAEFDKGNGPSVSSGRKKAAPLPQISKEETPYELPNGWSWIRLGNLVSFQGGSQPPKSKFIYEPRDGYTRLVQIRDFKSDAHLTFVPDECANRPVSEDDIMIGRYGPPVFQILRGLAGTYNVALMKADPRMDLISKDYLFLLLQDPRIQDRVVEESERTAGQSGVRKELLNMFVVGLPPSAEQKRIVAKVDQLLSQCDELSARLRERQSATQQLLTATIHHVLAEI